jgi:hypothetical protein
MPDSLRLMIEFRGSCMIAMTLVTGTACAVAAVTSFS